MRALVELTKLLVVITVTALVGLVGAAPARAGTFVYVSNADDGDIGIYALAARRRAGARRARPAAKVVMPMAVSPDRRFLYAAVRSKPYLGARLCDRRGHRRAEAARRSSPLAESFPYISLDKTGRFLFGASYGAPPGQRQRGRRRRARRRRAAAGDPGRAQRALDPHRREQQLRLRAHARHRPDLPVHLRREVRAARSNTPAVVADEAGDRPAPLRHVAPTTSSSTC